MGSEMPDKFRNGLLPMQCPTQKTLRAAVAAIIRDIQRDNGETDQDTADQLDALPALKAAARELTAYIASIESLRVAA